MPTFLRLPRRALLLIVLACAGCATQPAVSPVHAGHPAAAQPAPSGSSVAVAASAAPPVAVHSALAPPTPAEQRAAFVKRLLREHPQLNQAHIEHLLDQARVQPSILAAMTRPAEDRPWKDYRPIFLGQARIDAGIAFYRDHRALIDRTAARYGVPPQILVAILGVETYYGRQTGDYRVLDALSTLAFHYPPRAAFFQRELGVFLNLPRSELPAPRAELRGSYAGAMGWCQFMPSSFAHYAVSADDDGRADLWHSLPDILASTANYLAAHGWQRGALIAVRATAAAGATVPPAPGSAGYTLAQLAARGFTSRALAAALPPATPVTLLAVQGADGPEYWITLTNFQVIMRYNTSALYALAVTQLAGAIADGVDAAPAGMAAPR